MSLTLHVDTARWRAHLDAVTASYPRIVPVAKGNGYGFGLPRLATEAARLGADTLAVGTHEELPAVADVFPGDLLLLTPLRPFSSDGRESDDPRLIHTVSRVADLQALVDAPGEPRVIVELFTSMRRHGVPADDLPIVAKLLDRVRCEGWALHLPLPAVGGAGTAPSDSPASDGGKVSQHRREVETWIRRLHDADLPARRLWVSHLTPTELTELAAAHPDLEIRPRVGTRLWLSDRDAYQARAHVLDVHRVRRGDRFGYRQRRVPGDGYLVVLSGGTAHGVAMEAPSHVGDLRTRVKVLVASGLEASGRALSPFTIEGRRRWFAEPPHMQVSVVFVPSSVRPPDIGAEVPVNVGMTLTLFDRTVFD
jgi:alanine racemase-like protein